MVTYTTKADLLNEFKRATSEGLGEYNEIHKIILLSSV